MIRFICVLILVAGNPVTGSEEKSRFRISISHTVEGGPLLRDSLRYLLPSGERFSVSRLSYLLSEIAFETEDGDWVAAEDQVGLFDLQKGLVSLEFELPSRAYRAMRFSLGLPPGLNHSDPARYPARHALNPVHNQLHWNWADGYIFFALEGKFSDEVGRLKGFVYHFANDENKVVVSLPLKVVDSVNAHIELNFDLGRLLSFPAPLSFAKDGFSTHSHPGDAIASKLKKNLPSAFQLQRIIEFVKREAVTPPKPIDLPEAYAPFAFKMSRSFPMPDLPADNPLIKERVELGRALFFDRQLSFNGEVSCSSCHQPENAFSDERILSLGATTTETRRHSMPLFNLAWKNAFFWDGRVSKLREQVFHPIQHPDELGIGVQDLVERLRLDPKYKRLFDRAFSPGTVTREHIGLALENYLLSLVSHKSRFDEAMAGRARLSEEEKRGFELFMTEYEPRSRQFGADCFHCHGGALFTDNQFHNNGLKPGSDKGRGAFSGRKTDDFKFSTPSLRNVALTAPYMHDGSIHSLEEVVRHYSEGVHQSETLDPNLAKHPKEGIRLSESDQKALVAFLHTLTDPAFSAVVDAELPRGN